MAFGTLATRKNARLRLALSGTAGAGKTYSALLLAKEFGSKIGVMDSEHGSASKYAGAPGIPPFFLEELEEKDVQEYTAKVREAAEAGIDVLVIDSYSHSWIGAQETVDKMGGSKFSNGWKVVSPLVTKLVDTILSYPGHVIATMRSKAEYVIETDDKGKNVPRKIGLAAVARPGTEYEFDVMLDLTPDGALTVSKTRCSVLNGHIYTRDDVSKIGKTLKAWLSEGAPLTPVDALKSEIRTATAEQLGALVEVIKQLPAEDRAQLKGVYAARKKQLSEDNPE